MALSDQAAGGVDAAFPIWAGFAIHPILRASARLGFADDLRADRAHHAETIVHFGDVHVLGLGGRHLVSGAHGPVRAGGAEHVAAGLA